MEIKVSRAIRIFYSISSAISFWFLIYLYVSQKQEAVNSLINIILIYCGIQIFLTALMAIFRKVQVEEKGCTFFSPCYKKFVEWEEMEQKSVGVSENEEIDSLLLGIYANEYGDIMTRLHQFTFWFIAVSDFEVKHYNGGDYWGELAARRDELSEVIKKYQIELKKIK